MKGGHWQTAAYPCRRGVLKTRSAAGLIVPFVLANRNDGVRRVLAIHQRLSTEDRLLLERWP